MCAVSLVVLRAGITAARKNVGPSLGEVLSAHLGPDVGALPVVGTQWPAYEHVNVQLAIDYWLREPARSHELIGISDYQHQSFTIGDLAQGEHRYGPRVSHDPRPGDRTRKRLLTSVGTIFFT